MENIKFLTVPGLGSSGLTHWQSFWEKENPEKFKRIEQSNWDLPVQADWVKHIAKEIQKLDDPFYLIAHSLGCIAVVHWANRFGSDKIKGAFLVAPADVETSGRLSFLEGFNPIPKNKLPFESIVIASTNDQYASIGRSEEFANAWGSEFVNIGKKGHINASSNLGIWEQGLRLLNNFATK